jgi:transposase
LTQSTSHRRTAREWSRIVLAWQRSGKSAKEFAAERGISPRTLAWWRWRLAGRAESAPSEVEASPALRFVPVQVAAESVRPAPAQAHEAPRGWEIVSARGDVLRVHRDITEAELAAVLAAFGLAEGGR